MPFERCYGGECLPEEEARQWLGRRRDAGATTSDPRQPGSGLLGLDC
jgi:hypothetical protein